MAYYCAASGRSRHTAFFRADRLTLVAGEISRSTVLVVDDHQDIREFMKAALEGAGYEVRTAVDGAAAFIMLEEQAVDLLVTDIFMPGIDGFRTITRCKARYPQLKIIVMSAGTILGLNYDFLSTAALLGVGATLRKPFSADQLLEAVGRVLQPKDGG